MFYKINFSLDDDLQELLDRLCNYKNDLPTKIMHRKRLNLFYELLGNLFRNRIITKTDSAIDIGCGSGIYTKIISDFGFKEVVGIDVSPHPIEEANRNFAFSDQSKKLSFNVENAENIDLNKKYDFILCTEVIEHTAAPLKVADNIKAVLNSGGVAVISIPNSMSLPYTISILAKRFRGEQYSEDFKRHISYPFFRTLALFKEENTRTVSTNGANLFIMGPLESNRFFKKTQFSMVNHFDTALAKLWPLKYFTQFFFIAIKKIH